ncbi:HAMP domain-containing histidine kinase [Desulfuromonas sp. KJ2020]|uniref:sensor histidine kinase n=1 Tax=Desulfuromonas sp. KJ2020 TaxID=2919173 RepID=UPI00032279B6|nr:HAMP domain-containing sensor histidine kinase [Desulfuromonas sp. KJ2020]MCP3176810.1 HAMP domain-containing histidine kinase [Desulfuromonas sp. KJ2020]
MKLFRRVINPLFAFVAVQLIWVIIVISWVSWFMGSHRRLRALAEQYSPDLLQKGWDWLILIEGLLLLGAILAGVYVIFLYWRRQVSLYRAQHQFIAQVTHELKSPIASIQLHLETIRRRQPDPEQMDTFLDTMLADTDRLNTLVNNLLSANRLEQRGLKLNLTPCNLSELVTNYFRPQQYALPKAGTMALDIAPEIHVRADTDWLKAVFRNLLENALLYSNGPPVLTLSLKAEGGQAHLTFADQGRGLEKKELKKVFRMFYRVKPSGETIRGSGLGLFIIRAVILLHRGKVWIESEGLNRGVTVHITLPLISPGKENE